MLVKFTKVFNDIMTKIVINFLWLLGFSAFLISCQVEKKYHSSGFHVRSISPSLFSSTKENKASNFGKTHVTNKYPTIKKESAKIFHEEPTLLTYKKSVQTLSNTETLSKTDCGKHGNVVKDWFNSATKHRGIFPPDSIIIYDTVYEEEIMIIPDSIHKQYESLMAESKAFKEKSKTPTLIGYILLLLGGAGLAFSFMFFLFALGFGDGILVATLIGMAVSLLLVIIGGFTMNRGISLETQSRILARKAKALLAPYEPAKPAPQKMKKSTKKLLISLVAAYAALRFVTLFMQ